MAQHYDVAVIGAERAGIFAAALLAKRKRRVLLVDHGESSTTYRRRGLRLPLVPSLTPDLEGSPSAQRVHEELGLGPELRTLAKPLSPVFQAVLPRHRFAVPPNPVELKRELVLEFPELAPALENFFERLFALDEEMSAFLRQTVPLLPHGFLESLKSRRAIARASAWDAPFEEQTLLDGIPKDHPVRDVLLGPLHFFGHLSPNRPSTLQAVRLIARYFRGGIEFGDRLGGLTAFAWKAAKEAGVDVRRGVDVKSLSVEGRRLAQLELDGDRLAYTADFFIANTVGPFHELLPAHERHPKFLLEEQAVQPTGSLLVMNFVVHKDVVPCGMGTTLFLLNGRRAQRGDIPPDPPMFVQRFPAQRGDAAPGRGKDIADDGEHEVLSVACPVKTSEVMHSPERFAILKSQLVERLTRLVPFLREHLRDTSMPSDASTWDLDSEGPRRIDPWRLHPLYESTQRPLLGVAARSVRTYYKNLVRTGRDVLPGFGVEGEYMSGLAAADLVVELGGKKWQPVG